MRILGHPRKCRDCDLVWVGLSRGLVTAICGGRLRAVTLFIVFTTTEYSWVAESHRQRSARLRHSGLSWVGTTLPTSASSATAPSSTSAARLDIARSPASPRIATPPAGMRKRPSPPAPRTAGRASPVTAASSVGAGTLPHIPDDPALNPLIHLRHSNAFQGEKHVQYRL